MLRLPPSQITLTNSEILELKRRLDLRRLMNVIDHASTSSKRHYPATSVQASFSSLGPNADWFREKFLARTKSNGLDCGTATDQSTLCASESPADLRVLPCEAQASRLMPMNVLSFPRLPSEEANHAERVQHQRIADVVGIAGQQLGRHLQRDSRSISWSLRVDGPRTSVSHPPQDSSWNIGLPPHQMQKSRRLHLRSSSDPGQDEVPSLTIARRRERLLPADSKHIEHGTRKRSTSLDSACFSCTEAEESSVSEPGLLRTMVLRTSSEKYLDQCDEVDAQLPVPALTTTEARSGLLEVTNNSSPSSNESVCDLSTWTVQLPFREVRTSERQTERPLPTDRPERMLTIHPFGRPDPTRSRAYSNRRHYEANDDEPRPSVEEEIEHEEDQTMLVRPFRIPDNSLVMTSLVQSPQAEFAIARGGRRGFAAWQHYYPAGRPRRRRPNAEQENEDYIEEMEQERQMWLARAQGGELERTPPGQGRFERFLWDD